MASEKNIQMSRHFAENEQLGAGSGTHKEETELAASEKGVLVSTCQGGGMIRGATVCLKGALVLRGISHWTNARRLRPALL